MPPESIAVLNDKGMQIPHYILGPYNEGSSINITCVATGGLYTHHRYVINEQKKKHNENWKGKLKGNLIILLRFHQLTLTIISAPRAFKPFLTD